MQSDKPLVTLAEVAAFIRQNEPEKQAALLALREGPKTAELIGASMQTINQLQASGYVVVWDDTDDGIRYALTDRKGWELATVLA